MAAPKRITPSQGDDASDQGTPAPAASSLSLLAQQEFGANFHGDVEAPPKTPEQEEQRVGVPLPEISDEDLDEAGENVQVEGDDVEASKPDEAAEGAEQPIATVRELVEYLEADPEWFNNLEVDVKVHDKASRVSLKDLKDNFEISQAADERLEMAKAKSAQAQQELQARNEALDLQYQQAAALIDASEQKLMAQAASINWDQLHKEDPALWSAERVRIGEEAAQVKQAKDQARWQYQQVQAHRQQESEKSRVAMLQEQSQLLMENMPKVSPEWGDPQQGPAVKHRLMTYLTGMGYTPQEIDQNLDHRNYIVAEKARLWDESQSKMQITKKRIRTVPKVMKPGASREPSTVNLEKIRAAQQQLRKSGKVDDALTALKLLRQKRS